MRFPAGTTKFTAARSYELNVPLDAGPLQAVQLNEAERKQAAYWKPNTTGQSVFNHWD